MALEVSIRVTIVLSLTLTLTLILTLTLTLRIAFERPTRLFSLDEFHFLHWESLEADMAALEAHLCRHFQYCQGLFLDAFQIQIRQAFQAEAQRLDQGGLRASIETDVELKDVVARRFPCMLHGGFGYSQEPAGRIVPHREPWTQLDVHACLEG